MIGDDRTSESTQTRSTRPDDGAIHVVVDVPNILGGMREALASTDQTSSLARDVRLDVNAFHELMVAGRRLGSAVWAGTSRPSTAAVFARAARLDPTIRVIRHEPGMSGREVGIDAALQAHLLRLISHTPGVFVLATGDGAGWTHDEGFLADARRLVAVGWQIELVAWSCSTNRYLRTFAEEHGSFIPLEDALDAITYVPGQRTNYGVPLPDYRRIGAPMSPVAA